MALDFRFLTSDDVELTMRFIRELASYENRIPELAITEQNIADGFLAQNGTEVLLAFESDIPIGFVAFHIGLKSILGGLRMYMDDIYIRPSYQKKGYALAIERKACEIALSKGCDEIEWKCYEWNQDSINFCIAMGAHPVNDCNLYRLSQEAIVKLLNK